jgi:biotin transporter BioY
MVLAGGAGGYLATIMFAAGTCGAIRNKVLKEGHQLSVRVHGLAA